MNEIFFLLIKIFFSTTQLDKFYFQIDFPAAFPSKPLFLSNFTSVLKNLLENFLISFLHLNYSFIFDSWSI